jgi:putative lipoprotein
VILVVVGRQDDVEPAIPEGHALADGREQRRAVGAAVDKDLLGKKTRLTVAARIEAGGKLRFISDKAYPALKDGQPVPVEMVLKPVTSRK